MTNIKTSEKRDFLANEALKHYMQKSNVQESQLNI